MRLNIGSGQAAVPSWTNIDRSTNIMHGCVPGAKRILNRVGLSVGDGHVDAADDAGRLDVNRLPFADRSVDAIYSSHTLQHLQLWEAESVLGECARVLKPGGILRLALSEVEPFSPQPRGGEASARPGSRPYIKARMLTYLEDRPHLRGQVKSALGGHINRWQTSASEARQLLLDAGLVHIYDREFGRGRLPGLGAIETREDSLFIEATTLA